MISLVGEDVEETVGSGCDKNWALKLGLIFGLDIVNFRLRLNSLQTAIYPSTHTPPFSLERGNPWPPTFGLTHYFPMSIIPRMATKIPEQIEKLVEAFDRNIDAYKSNASDETKRPSQD